MAILQRLQRAVQRSHRPAQDVHNGVSRRGFLSRLLVLPLGVPPTQPLERTESFSLGQFYVAGFQYYGGLEIVDQLHRGQRYELVAEPENPYDEFAVAIYWGTIQLGYVPRTENRQISRLLQQSAKLNCQAVWVEVEAPPWQLLEVEILTMSSSFGRSANIRN